VTRPIVRDDGQKCDVTLTSRRAVTWASQFSSKFPRPTYGQKPVHVPSTGYTSISFKTGSYTDTGAISTFQMTGTQGGRLISISDTPGCFNVPDECKTTGRSKAIGWSVGSNKSGFCKLDRNKTYYWNVTFTDGANPFSGSCGSSCQTYLSVSNRN
jgi:hypothetical protein